MRKSFACEDPKIGDYVSKVFAVEEPMLQKVITKTKEAGFPQIQVADLDGLHIEVLAAAFGAKKAVEFGTLNAYSGIRFLRGMGEGAFLHTLEKSEDHADLAAENFREAGYEQNVKIWRGTALDNLANLAKEGPFDLAFLDADKENYSNYFDWCADNLRIGGTVLADNCFAFGLIAEEKFDHPNSEKIVGSLRAFNQKVADDSRFRSTMIPTSEGLLMAVKIR